jgi:hypothetical protein
VVHVSIDASGYTETGQFIGTPGSSFGWSGTPAFTFALGSRISGDQVSFVDTTAAIYGTYNVTGSTTIQSSTVMFDGSATVPDIGNLTVDSSPVSFGVNVGQVGNITVTSRGAPAALGTVTFNGTVGGPNQAIGDITVEHDSTLNFLADVSNVGNVTIGTGSATNGNEAGAIVNFSDANPITVTMASLTFESNSPAVAGGGTLTGNDNFVVSGTFNWLDGTLAGPAGTSLLANNTSVDVPRKA